MISSTLRQKLEIFRPDKERTPFGSESVVWTLTATARAQRLRLLGGRRIEGDELFYSYTAEWNIRSYHEIHEGWRVREVGGMLYEVTTVEFNHTHGYITIRAQRVNE